MPVGVKPPPSSGAFNSKKDDGEDEDENVKTGRFSAGLYATWVGNALVLGSLGTLALIVTVTDDSRRRQIEIISDILLATAAAVIVWCSYKYFCVGPRHHWSSYLGIIFILATLAAFIWTAVVI
jgi:hypothetical protein